jgi:hypothetical protein
MKEDHESMTPLPRKWLPEPAAPADAPEWEALARRIMSAAGPALDRQASADPEAGWAVVLGSWLRPALVFAAASAAIVVVAYQAKPVQGVDRPSVPLAVLASDGDPAALWQSLGITADPVLGLIALQGAPR